MNQKNLAEKLGLSRGRVSALIKDGMPSNSLAAAIEWRIKNQKKPSRSLPILAGDVDFVKNVEQEKRQPINTSGEEEDSLARLLRSKNAEKIAFGLLVQATKEKNALAMKNCVVALAMAQKRVHEAQIEHLNEKARLRQTLSTAEVKEKYIKHIGSLRSLLDAMPSSLCARANPSDPECAKQALEEGVNQLYIAIQKGEGAFG
jgi:hypothetical protein